MKLAARIVWSIAQWPIGLAWWAYWILVRSTSKISISGAAPEGAAIFVNFHRHQPVLIPHHGESRRWMLVSPAPVLAPVARFCLLSGLRLVRGTSRDRGKQALDELVQVIGSGGSVTMAVDGPAGPVFEVKRGCVELAQRTGAPIIPVSYSSRRGRTLEWRWDHTLLPVPFDEIHLRYGTPVDTSGALESAVENVRAALAGLDTR